MMRSVDADVNIATAENVSFRHQVAGPFRRLPAFTVDLGLRVIFMGLIALVLAFLAPIASLTGITTLAVGILIWFIAEWFYGGLFETYWNGQTPGKRLFGLRVVSVDGRPINGMQAVLRNILRAVDILPVVPLTAIVEEGVEVFPTFFVGLACLAYSRHFQRLGDIVCGTIVVVEETQFHIQMEANQGNPRIVALQKRLPPQFRAGRTLARALAMYAERRDAFSAARRHEIARHLAEPLMKKWKLADDTDYDELVLALYRLVFLSQSDETQAAPFVMDDNAVEKSPVPLMPVPVSDMHDEDGMEPA
jgi:uncharacterized RDD family membrane protein YckC